MYFSHAAFWLIVGFIICLQVGAQDFFHTRRSVPKTTASPLLGAQSCLFGQLSKPLTLPEAVERSLCNNPKTRQAWVNIETAAAAVGIGRAAYLPTLSVSWQEAREGTTTKIDGYPQYNSGDHVTDGTGNVSFSWVLYDFGSRRAALRNANELLLVAQASHEASLQDVFAAVAGHYYAVQAAESKLTTAVENERTAKDSLDVAKSRVEKGIAPMSDSLQAETAHLQSVVNRIKAEGDRQSALGTLAVDMALQPDESIELPAINNDVQLDDYFEQTASSLIEEALGQHPSIRAADADLKAAQAKVAQIRAGGRPNFSLLSKASRAEQPASIGLGLPPYLATVRDVYVGIQVSMPLFEGFSRDYQIRQAEAQIKLQKEVLRDTRQRVALDVWTTYQSENAAKQNLSTSFELLDIAQQAYAAAYKRYVAGVGGVIELLTTQSSLANARQEQVEALTNLRTSRLQLISKLGKLGMHDIARE
jgi:outer membrane protein